MGAEKKIIYHHRGIGLKLTLCRFITSTMTKYKCECLNVTLHVKEKSVREANGKDFVTVPSGLFAEEICEVDLAVAGITKVSTQYFVGTLILRNTFS